MATAQIWSSFKSNFKRLLEVTITGWTESDTIDIAKRSGLPSSIWDHSYSVQLNGMPKPFEYINDVIDVKYNVRLQLSFELSEHDEKITYDAAIAEIEDLIIKRLDATTWQNEAESNIIVNIEHVLTSPFIFISQSSSDEHFGVVNIDFLITGRNTF